MKVLRNHRPDDGEFGVWGGGADADVTALLVILILSRA